MLCMESHIQNETQRPQVSFTGIETQSAIAVLPHNEEQFAADVADSKGRSYNVSALLCYDI
jgi:hypothetical protein